MTRKKLKSYLEAAPVFCLYLVFSLFPLSLLRNFFSFLAKTLGPVFPVSRKAAKNLEACFPNLSADQKHQLIRGCWENLGKIAAEYFCLEKITQDPSYFTVENQHYIDPIIQSQKGAIFFSAHLGNWELTYAGLLQQKVPIALIKRIQRNPFSEWFVSNKKKKQGIEMIDRTPAGSRQLVRSLRNGAYIGALFDIYDSEGTFLPFFSKPAKTSVSLARVAMRLGYCFIPTQVIRTASDTFIIRYHPPLDPALFSSPEAVMQQVNALIESWIRENPEQWLWLHDRWKVKKKDTV